MTSVLLGLEDLDHLALSAPGLCFDDTERKTALLENGSRDFNAVPGSGKTSLLAVKLLLLAKKWPHTHKGICILSHTNVAREEITSRLSKSTEGAKLLAYPHYIGTIHSFINHFLAMAELRRRSLKVDVIDDDIFAKRVCSVVGSPKYRGLRNWLFRQRNAEALLSGLYYKGATLEVLSEGGRLPGSNTPTYKKMVELKKALADEGVFKHRDMFAYAELALADNPRLFDVVHRRFPMVFIDEMQDTSWEQEYFLSRLFDNKSVIQRFGDVDQKIISGDPNADKVTFPKADHGTISTSKRFGKCIAEAVASVSVSQLPVVGEARDTCKPILMLYKANNINNVLNRFGEIVIERFTEDTLEGQQIRAMCARRSGEGKVAPGRHMADYWPAFELVRQTSTQNSLQTLLQNQNTSLGTSTLAERVNNVRRGVLMVLRAAKAPVTDGVRDSRTLLRTIREHYGDSVQVDTLIRELTLNSVNLVSANDWHALSSKMYMHLAGLLPNEMSAGEFAALDLFANPPLEEKQIDGELPTICTVIKSDRKLEYSLGTIASMKGETHIASLVLESYGGKSRRFDLEIALPFIAGIGKNFRKLTSTQKVQMQNLYVAMSRPTGLLCVAANEARVEKETIEALIEKGWEVDRMS